MPTYFTPITNSTAGNAVAWNDPLTELDDQLVLMAAGSGFNNQSANRIFAGPSSGSAAAPTFRALVDDDIPAALTLVGGTINNTIIGGTTPTAGTFSTLTVTGSGDVNDIVNGVAGQNRVRWWRTSNTNRWAMFANNTAESGSNAGSDMRLARYNDAGTFQGYPIQISRATGDIILESDLTIGGDLDHNGATVGLYGVTPVARATGYTTFSNLSTDRTCDANSTSVAELADILGTLIEDLKLTGIIGA